MFGNKDRAFDQITEAVDREGRRWVSHVRKRPKNKPFFSGLPRPMLTGHEYNRGCNPVLPKDVLIPPYLVDTPITRDDLPDIIMRSAGLITMWDW